MYKAKYILYIVAILSIFLMFSGDSTFADNVDYSVNVAPSLKLTIPDSSLVLNLNPPSKTFDSKDLTVTVGTNNATGYKLTLSTLNDNTDLERDTSSDTTVISATIPTLDTGTYTESTFTANKWGYSINSNTAIPSTVTSGFIPFVSGNTLMERDTAINHDETELSFASKIDYLQPAGAYSTTLQFNIVANPPVNYIQDLNPALCTTTPMTVVDKRDNQEYVIQRLADGNCWMMTNLNLGATTLTTDLTSANTNLSTTVTAATFNGWKKSTGTATSTAGEYIPVSGTDSTSQTPYGTLYNYCAVSAGTNCSGGKDSLYDICPTGWRLPTAGQNGEIGKLFNNGSYNTVAKLRAPINTGGLAIAFAGYFLNRAPQLRDQYGIWWASDNGGTGANRMDSAYVSTTSFAVSNNPVVANGYSVRCILNDSRTISDITTMQEMSPQIAAKMNNGDTATLKDSRDGQDYTVAKINGNVWMTRNLAIGCNGTGSTYGSTITSKTLTSSDSNISAATWSTPTNSLTLGNDYTDPRMECSSTYGAWYNYAAASAGTITSNSNSNETTESICPLGWKIPSKTNIATITSNTTYRNLFLPADVNMQGGLYKDGTISFSTQWAFWWTSTPTTATYRNVLYNEPVVRYLTYNDGSSYGYRTYGIYVRCIAK